MPFKWKNQEKEYHKKYHAKWYKKNREKVLKAARGAKARKLAWFRNLKDKYSCEHCGANHPAIIEFHHNDPSQKDFSLAKFDSRSKKKVLEELKKCIALCRNCHAIVHWKERQ